MPIRAMLVDDHDEIRALMRMILQTAEVGVTVECEAATGAEALDLLDHCDPTVIVLDQMMPGLSGIETAERILQRRPAQKLVFCSAYVDERLRATAERIGFAAVVHKEQLTQLPEILVAAADCRG